MIDRRAVLAFTPLLFAPAITAATEKPAMRFNPPSLPPPVGFSHISEARGRLIWLSGQVPRTADGTHVAPGDFPAQLEQVFQNLAIAVREAGGKFSDVVKLNYYCHQDVDRTLLRHVNLIRDRYVDTARPPASTFIFVSALARPEWLIEIEAVVALAEEQPEIVVHATLTAEKPFSQKFLNAAQKMAKATRSEPGCLTYRMACDVENSGVLVLAERWASEQALRLHFETAHMAAFQEALRVEGRLKTALEVFELRGAIAFSLDRKE